MLGNLVILKARQTREISGKKFLEKRETYRDSGYYVTRMIADYDQWGVREIRERQEELARAAVATWSTSVASHVS